MLDFACDAPGADDDGSGVADESEQTWSHVIPVGSVTNYTVVGITKDNYLFGS